MEEDPEQAALLLGLALVQVAFIFRLRESTTPEPLKRLDGTQLCLRSICNLIEIHLK